MYLTTLIFRPRISFAMGRSIAELSSSFKGAGTVVGYPDLGTPPIHSVKFKQPISLSVVKTVATNLSVEVFRPRRVTSPQPHSVGR